jgi:hypothetical protein
MLRVGATEEEEEEEEEEGGYLSHLIDIITTGNSCTV